MKATAKRHPYSARNIRRYAYPGAAEPHYFTEKLLDGITAFVTGLGAVTVLFFLMTM